MFLIGQYDSPFVRRVAIALRFYGLAFEHKPWSTFAAMPRPSRRIIRCGGCRLWCLDDGEALIESTAILDFLDELVGPDRAMIAERGPDRRHHLKICALGSGLGDKAVSLVYERVLRKDQLKLWVERAVRRRSAACWLCWSRNVPACPRRTGSATPRSRRHHGRLRAALLWRGASASVQCRALSGTGGARRALRVAAAVPGDRAAARAPERGSGPRFGLRIPAGVLFRPSS